MSRKFLRYKKSLNPKLDSKLILNVVLTNPEISWGYTLAFQNYKNAKLKVIERRANKVARPRRQKNLCQVGQTKAAS